MESLSRPFQSRKLSNVPTKHHKYAGAKPIDVDDYREIFGSSQAASSSIPVLDLSTLRERSDALNVNMLTSKPDYSNIFGFRHDDHHDVAVCYQELFASDKFRPSSSTTTTSHDSYDLSRQSSDGLKQFKMSYNKINQKSKDELDETKHVTQLHAIPGFTRFIDEQAPPPKMKSEKQPIHVSVDSSKDGEFVSEDTKIKTFDIDFKIQSSTVSSSPINVVNHKSYPKRSMTTNSMSYKTDTSPTSFDDELDVNSAASALRKAIETAQESIRIAKESVGRKKKGLENFSNKNSKDILKVKDRTEDVIGATSSQVFSDFMYGEKLSVTMKVIDEMNRKFSESNKFKDNNTIISNSTRATGETESKPLDSAGKYQYATSASEAVHTDKTRTEPMEFVHEDQTINMVVDDYEGKIEVIKTTAGALEYQSVVEEVESVERVEVDMFRESNENKDGVRLSNAHEPVEKSNNLIVSEKVEDEKKVSEESNQCDNETRLQSLENEKQEEVLEQEDVENAENAESHKGIEEVSGWSESENESEDDHDTEIHEEETNEMFNDVCELEMKARVQNFDKRIEESETTLHIDCEMKQEDNRTGERTGERLDNTFVQEFEKKPSCDENVMEEIDNVGRIHESCKVDMNDDNVETTQEIDDATEATEGADALEEAFCETDNKDEYEVKSEENDVQSESFSGTIDGVKIEDDESNKEEDIIDNLADLGSENDVQSESSSSSAKTVEEESNTQLPHKEIPDTIKDSQEPQYRDKEDEIGEPGPSKMWGKEHFRRIDEATAREREHEKNRLAVNRAIREARERAFVEARVRAERDRAAVEKATAEVRQRMMADARENVAKASVATKSSSERTSAESKLRAERAAVERATSEARQRALEKAMSQKSVSDLNSSESALRSKAKLEKHNRIMERAAKALAEKEKRDLFAQKEQAERNRLAENLDANIERWSNRKEGNLRALLSTLQYILGPESGWQAVSLTEIITSSAVKKAYRKATLCVHPDKLQQRGATIQHKYICEKVFDLLKAAWNRFNSEER